MFRILLLYILFSPLTLLAQQGQWSTPVSIGYAAADHAIFGAAVERSIGHVSVGIAGAMQMRLSSAGGFAIPAHVYAHVPVSPWRAKLFLEPAVGYAFGVIKTEDQQYAQLAAGVLVSEFRFGIFGRMSGQRSIQNATNTFGVSASWVPPVVRK